MDRCIGGDIGPQTAISSFLSELDVEVVLRSVVPSAVAAGFESDKGKGERPTLCPRETEVLRLMALGHTNREIAEQLSLSVRTVETHRSHIQQKLGLDGRPELTRYALGNGSIE